MRARAALLGSLAFLLAGAGAQQSGIARVGWLRGCWEARSPTRTIEEQWLAPRAGTMLNMGRTIRGDSLFEYEQVLLREHGERLTYEAHPSGQPAALFVSSSISDSSVVFENAGHDFPQRVGYQRRGADSLLAWIDGAVGGRARRVDFRYGRVGCPGSPP